MSTQTDEPLAPGFHEMTAAQYRPVIGFDGRYEVSSNGNIRSVTRSVRCGNGQKVLTAQPLRPHVNEKKGGYFYICLWANDRPRTLAIHLIVALAFLPPGPSPKHEVDHRDRDKTNNSVNNLRWATRRINGLNVEQRTPSKSGVRGVYYCKERNMWCAWLGRQNLGRYKTKRAAKSVRLRAYIQAMEAA